MCSCEPGFTCRQCAGTPFDPYYFEDDPPPVGVDEFEQLTTSGRNVEQGWLYDPRIK